MTPIDDDILMALADGELEASRAAEVQAALKQDAALRARLQQMQDTDALLRAAVAPALDMPERLTMLLQQPSNVIAMPANASRAQGAPHKQWWLPAGAAVAAALAVWLTGSAILSESGGWLRHVDDGVAISGPLQAAAIGTRSGGLVTAGDLSVRPVVSFVANDGRACRELHVRDKEMAARIVACRDLHEDEWCIEAFASMPTHEFQDVYQPAGVPRNPVIDAALARLGVKEILGAKEENEAIARKWSAN